MSCDKTPRLALSGISKSYPSVIANQGIDLTVQAGEIHALLGENGAGKSTLMKIVYGVTPPDAGEILWEGRQVTIDSPAVARRLGIGMVFQHFALFESLTVAENISLSLDDPESIQTLSGRITKVSEHYGLPIDPRRMVHTMSVGERQRVEIVRCLLQDPKLLIMDEPTSVLTPQAVLVLFDTLRRLAAEGCSILYISHKLDEIRALCDAATVLRGGQVTGYAKPKHETSSQLARLMIGCDLPECASQPQEAGHVMLEVNGLSLCSKDPFGTHLQDIDLQVRSGEIMGIAGISGNGQKELLLAISGEVQQVETDTVVVCQHAVGRMNPAQRRRQGLNFVPEERLGRGAVPSMSLSDNALLTGARQGMVQLGVIQRQVTRSFTRAVIERFKVACGGPAALATSLSGGNLQKFIVGREILLNPKVMVVSQPTWGVDVGAAILIRQSLIDLRTQGVAILVISEELDELFMICDKIAVIAKGRLSEPMRTADTSSEQIGMQMSGEILTKMPHQSLGSNG